MRLKCINNIDYYGGTLYLTIGRYYKVDKVMGMKHSYRLKKRDLNSTGTYQLYIVNDLGEHNWYRDVRFDLLEYFRNETIKSILK